MDTQEIFDTVARALMKQRVASINPETGDCLYRCGELRCAVGWLIPDDRYTPDFEDEPVDVVINLCGIPTVKNGSDEAKLLSELQRAHDRRMPRVKGDEVALEKWKRSMKDIAATFDLSWSVLNEEPA